MTWLMGCSGDMVRNPLAVNKFCNTDRAALLSESPFLWHSFFRYTKNHQIVCVAGVGWGLEWEIRKRASARKPFYWFMKV